MGEKAKIILNEYSAKSMLRRENLDLDKFYTADLKLMVEVARKEIQEIDKSRMAMASDLHDRKLEIERLTKVVDSNNGTELNYYVAGLQGSIKERDEYIAKLIKVIDDAKAKAQEFKDHLDKSGFDRTTKTILMMGINEIVYCLNRKDE